jgi:hypothetical protein
LRLIIAIEVDEENNIVEKTLKPHHIFVFPLIDSEKHLMPIVINSPLFEPDSERKALIPDGIDYHQENNITTDTGINLKKFFVIEFHHLKNYYYILINKLVNKNLL